MSAAGSRTESQVFALAGMFQAADLVVQLAREGKCDEAAYAVSIASVLRLDAGSCAEVYGGVAALKPGLEQLVRALDASRRDPAATRIVVTVMHLERRLRRMPALLEAIRSGVLQAARTADALGVGHESVSERLAELYAQTISTLRPRVIVQGNGLYLGQARVVGRIRALLLATVRSGVLWRQTGGSRLRLLLGRRDVCATARRLLAAESTSTASS